MMETEKARTILMLQGPASPLWRELGAEFEAAGARVVKITVSMADTFFWWRSGAIAYRGRISGFPPFLERLIIREGITDILCYADRLPYHVIAGEVARRLDIPLIVLENGYLRPDWITLERSGLGAFSHFPDDPERIHAIAAKVPDVDLVTRYPHGFWQEMVYEYFWQILPYFWLAFYPFYRSGKYYNPFLEIVNGLWKRLYAKRKEAEACTALAKLFESSHDYCVFALQLQGDYQIRDNSSYQHLSEVIVEVISSFAANAPPAMRLVIKQHPHDNGIERWERLISHEATRLGLEDRIMFIDGGDLGALLTKAAGAVMVNSTVGLFSIRLGCPTKILGLAIYDLPGLTHRGDLASFWQNPSPVDAILAKDFVKALAATIQVKGSFFNPRGRAVAVREIARRVLEHRVNMPDAFFSPPPRVGKAFWL